MNTLARAVSKRTARALPNSLAYTADVVVVLYVVDVSQESGSNQHLIDVDDLFSFLDVA
jgi:hypothetical protein